MVRKQLAPTETMLKKIEELSGENVFACYQCGMCSAGCPFTDEDVSSKWLRYELVLDQTGGTVSLWPSISSAIIIADQRSARSPPR